jgi:hypothetical protein
MTICKRLDTKTHGERVELPILSEVMGLSSEIPSLVLLLFPTREEQDLFWREFGFQLKPEDEVFVAKGYVQAETVCDIRHRPLPAFSGLSGKAALFFVDRNPPANWAHDCWYVLLLLQERRFVKAEHRMPPPDEIDLFRLYR